MKISNKIPNHLLLNNTDPASRSQAAAPNDEEAFKVESSSSKSAETVSGAESKTKNTTLLKANEALDELIRDRINGDVSQERSKDPVNGLSGKLIRMGHADKLALISELKRHEKTLAALLETNTNALPDDLVDFLS